MPPVPPPPPFKMAQLPIVNSIDEVVDTLQVIIDWSIEAKSCIGYFAVLYKRATIAIRQAIEEKKFDDPARMERFDLTFASRYFQALNAYFHPGDYETPTHVWQVALDGYEYDEPIMLQQMLTALTAHVTLDLGIAAAATGGDRMDSLRKDFKLINALLASQVDGLLDVVAKLSPGVQVLRVLIPDEVGLIKEVLERFRDMAWTFAQLIAAKPQRNRAVVNRQDSWSAVWGNCCLYPPDEMTWIVDAIAATESRDIAKNIRALDKVASTPGALVHQFL